MTDYERGLEKLGFVKIAATHADLRTDAAFAWRVLEALPYSEWWRIIQAPTKPAPKQWLADALFVFSRAAVAIALVTPAPWELCCG